VLQPSLPMGRRLIERFKASLVKAAIAARATSGIAQ
jgi:hypothetical protein